MDLQQLNDNFTIPGVLTFDEPHPGMARASITTPACTAELYLQGAHLTHWQPTGHQPVLYLSPHSAFTPGKAIRGGVPIIFPWFGSPETSPVHPPAGAPSHGFARTTAWSFAHATLVGDDLHLALAFGPTDATRALGFDNFLAVYELILGHTLTLRLSIANRSPQPLLIEEALHTYFAVGDVRQVQVTGLQGVEYLDKTDDLARKQQTDPTLRFIGETDRPYLNTANPITLEDPILNRRITLTKSGSNTTVTWNPGPALSAQLADLGPDAWPHFACLETANAADNAITLPPLVDDIRATPHVMEARITVEPLRPELPSA